MRQVCDDEEAPISQKSSKEWARLIHKLRWIGMESEARRLELALSTLPAEERSVSAEPPGID
jgi:hypothetical protein